MQERQAHDRQGSYAEVLKDFRTRLVGQGIMGERLNALLKRGNELLDQAEAQYEITSEIALNYFSTQAAFDRYIERENLTVQTINYSSYNDVVFLLGDFKPKATSFEFKSQWQESDSSLNTTFIEMTKAEARIVFLNALQQFNIGKAEHDQLSFPESSDSESLKNVKDLLQAWNSSLYTEILRSRSLDLLSLQSASSAFHNNLEKAFKVLMSNSAS